MTSIDTFRQRLYSLRKDARRASTYAAWGGVGAFLGDLITEPASDIIATPSNMIFTLINVSVRLAFVGAGATAGLAACATTRGTWRAITLPAVLRPARWGALAGAVSGFVAQLLYVTLGGSEMSRVIAWSVGGGLLGLVLAPYVPNLLRTRATAGGAIGGALGGLAFIALANVLGDTFGRFAGLAMIGAAIGAMVVIADAMLRSAWIEARYDTGHVETRTLGETWVIVGSDERLVSIYSSSAPAWGLRYRLDGGAIDCEDSGSRFRGAVKAGDRRRTGNVEVVVYSSSEVTSATPAPPPTVHPNPTAKPSPTPTPAPSPSGAPQRPAANARTFTAQIRRDRAIVGSGTTCEILVQAQGVAASHVEIRRDSGALRIGPISGSVVHHAPTGLESDLRPITGPTELREGSLIAFGPARATFRDAPARLEITA